MRRKISVFQILNWIFAFCAVLALSTPVQVFSMEEVLNCTGGRTNLLLLLMARLRLGLQGEGAVMAVLFTAAVYIYPRALFGSQKPLLPSAAIVSFCFTVWTMLGMSYAALGSWDFVFGNGFQMLQSVVLGLGWWSIFYCAVSSLYRGLDVLSTQKKTVRHRRKWFFQRHFMLCSFGIIFLAWLPHLWVFFPGTISTDSFYQLEMYCGLREFTNHWPYVSTLLLGGFYQLGRTLLSESTAIFAYIAAQSLVCALCYAYVCVTVHRLTRQWLPAVCTLLYFALVPCWGAYAVCAVKDTMYAGLFAWFGASFCLAVSEREKLPAGRIAQLILSGSLAMFFRNDLIYIALPALLVLFFISRKGAKFRVIVMIAGLVAMNVAVYRVVQPALGIADGPTQEMLSVPFQQVARDCITYGEELTEEEAATIDAVLDYEKITRHYDPELSDNVKNTYRSNAQDEEYRAFWALYFKRLRLHPDAYLQATFHNSFGYWYPGYFSGLHCYNTVYLTTEIQKSSDFEFKLSRSPFFHNLFYSFYLTFTRLPVLSLLEMPGTPSWLLLLIAGAAARKKKFSALCGCAVVLMAFAVCVASPVNGALRYVLPQLAYLPSLLALTMKELGV